MKELVKVDGVIYTQNIDNIPVEERVFFKAAVGMNADEEHFRPATPKELEDYEAWRAEEAKMMMP